MTGPLSDAQLDAIAARADAATAGPWLRYFSDAQKADHIRSVTREWVAQFAATEADAEFIAAARTDVPKLVAEVRRLRGQVDAVRAACTRAEDVPPRFQGEWVVETDVIREALDGDDNA